LREGVSGLRVASAGTPDLGRARPPAGGIEPPPRRVDAATHFPASYAVTPLTGHLHAVKKICKVIAISAIPNR
jgi:hypothetical protein